MRYSEPFSLKRSYRRYVWEYDLDSYDPKAATCRLRFKVGTSDPLIYICEFGLYVGLWAIMDDGNVREMVRAVGRGDMPTIQQAMVDGMCETFGIKDAPHDKPGTKFPSVQ